MIEPISRSASGGRLSRAGVFPRCGGTTGPVVFRRARGHFSHSKIVGGVDGIAASRIARARAREKAGVFLKSTTRGWS